MSEADRGILQRRQQQLVAQHSFDSDSEDSSLASLGDNFRRLNNRLHHHHHQGTKREHVAHRLLEERKQMAMDGVANGRAWVQSHAHMRRDGSGNLLQGVDVSPARYVNVYNPPAGGQPVLAPTPIRPSRVHDQPSDAYIADLHQSSVVRSGQVRPKSKLLISDLDNTLYAPVTHLPDHGVIPRPFLRTFLDYILHPESPYEFAVWTFAGEFYGIKHLRFVGEGRLFLDQNETQPLLADGVAACWGLEQSGSTTSELNQGIFPKVKDLDLMWDMLNLHRANSQPEWCPLNSLIIDDQMRNAAAQPDSLIRPPVYRDTTDASGVMDDWLLQLIGALDELAHESNFAAAIKARGWNYGIHKEDEGRYMEKGREVCMRMGIKIRRGKKPRVDLRALENISSLPQLGPPHDATPIPTDRKGRVDVEDLRGCCQDSPHPEAVIQDGPPRDAKGIVDFPNEAYEKVCAQPSQLLSRPRKPLICFDLDGTLYQRPPCHIDPMGYPTPRPYLLTFLNWLLRPESPWTVAIWTASNKATAVRCLNELGLGLVGPKLIGEHKDEAELLHPALVALFAREDLGLDKEDFMAYVAVTKDFDILWHHLESDGAGKWSPYDTVMIDDTPNKMRAQPDTVIAPPTFRFPLDPGADTSVALLDTFLLQLVGMLDELVLESNFANYISSQHWNEGVPKSRAEEFLEKGLKVLKKEKIKIYAEGFGPVDVSGQTRSQGSTYSRQARSSRHLDAPPSETSAPLGIDTQPFPLQGAPPPYSSQTGRPLFRTTNVTTDSSESDHDSDLASEKTDTSDESLSDGEPVHHRTRTRLPIFVREEKERARLHNHRPVNNLRDAVLDWEGEIPQNPRGQPPLVQNEPYTQGGASYRRSNWNPNDDDDTTWRH